MKKILLSMLLMLTVFATNTFAQINPQPGYIVTNNGDTIRGTLDLRTNHVNTQQCLFQAEGESEYKKYLPGEIDSYVFDIGKHYLTRRFEVNGSSDLYFAELIVQGMTSVYKVASVNHERLFVINENGEMTSFLAENGAETLSQVNSPQRTVGRNNLRQLLRNSPTTADLLNDRTLVLSEDNIIDLVTDYHKHVCTDGSECLVFKKKNGADRLPMRPWVSAGRTWRTLDWQKVDAEGYHVGVGVEFAMPRVNKHLYANAALRYSFFNCKTQQYSYTDNLVTLEAGIVYKLPIGKVANWYVNPGLNADILGWESNRKHDVPNGNYTAPLDSGINYFSFLYLSTGFGFNIDQQKLFIDVRYRGDHFKTLSDARFLLTTGLKW